MELSVSKTVSCIKKFVHEQKNNREKNKPYYLKEDCMKLLETILEVNKFEFAKKIIEVLLRFIHNFFQIQQVDNIMETIMVDFLNIR